MSAPTRKAIVTTDGQIGGILCVPAISAPDAPLLVCVHGGGCNGRYFDLKGASLVQEALRRNLPVLQVDRPGYGASAPPDGGVSPIAHGAAAVHALIGTVRATMDVVDRPIAMIGHSIGAAVALTYAVQIGWRPLAALCVSGIGDRPSADVVGFADRKPMGSTIEPPADWFFGPEGSYGWKGVMALRAAAEPWRADEVDDVIRDWPERWSGIARAVACPVHFRLAEFERIWETGPDALDRISTAFTRTKPDAAILPEGGHLYELHKRGAELIASQLDFIMAQARTR